MNTSPSPPRNTNEAYKQKREEYLITNWNIKNLNSLEILVDDIKELGDKTSLEENEILSCKLGKLEHEAVRLYEELKTKKEKQRKTRIKIGIGIGITVITLAQPYFIDEIKTAGKNLYELSSNYIESFKGKEDSQ